MFDRILQRLAQKSDHEHYKHAVLVLKGGSLISTGYNNGATHAEVQALNKLWPNRRTGTVVISVRVRKDGSFAAARPCPVCWQFLVDNRVDKVIYSNGRDSVFSEERV